MSGLYCLLDIITKFSLWQSPYTPYAVDLHMAVIFLMRFNFYLSSGVTKRSIRFSASLILTVEVA